MAKNCLLYGFIAALAQSLMTLGLFFAGLHSDPAKLGTANGIGSVLGLIIGVVCITLCIRAVRAQTPADKPFGYGSALGTGTLQGVFTSIFATIFTFVYSAFINPAYCQVQLDNALAKAQEKGVSGAQLDRIESIDRHIFTPLFLSVLGFFLGIFFAFLLSLIIAAFVRRSSAEPPPVAA